MEPYTKGTAAIRHRGTGVVYEIEAHELDWEQNGGDERGMGSEIRYEAIVEHPHLGMLTWALWEYPLGIKNRDDTDVGSHEILKNFDFGLEHVRRYDEDDLWVDYGVPDDPFAVYKDSYYMTGDLIADHGGDQGDHILNRMVFSHQITAMEAYLGDTLLKNTLDDTAAMSRLMKQDRELLKERFSLIEVAESPDLVKNKIRDYLRGVVYHDLKRVDFLYKVSLGFPILNLTPHVEVMLEAIKIRHDCVHRNGANQAGEKLKLFTKDFVHRTADMIKDFVESIERKVRQLRASG